MTTAEWSSALEQYVLRLMEQDGLPGVGVGVARDGQTVYARGFGFRDREQGLPVTPNTVFGIGSATKSFTCVAIMQLQEAGRLTVDDPVVKYVPEYRTANAEYAKATTIHHLMTHTAGLPPTPLLGPAMMESAKDDPSAADMLARIGDMAPLRTADELPVRLAELNLTPLGAPGQVFSYSNDAYGLLGLIIERVSGRSYTEYITENILAPCGMTRSTLDVGVLSSMDDVTELYARRPREDGSGTEVCAAPGWWQAPSMLAAGFLRASVPDMLRYLEIFRNGGNVYGQQILKPESVAAMTHPHVEYEPGQHYGYGLQVTVGFHGVTLVGHGGSIKGVQADIVTSPEAGYSAVALTNLGKSPASLIMMGAMNAALGLPVDTPRVHYGPYECAPQLLPGYVGTYKSDEGVVIEVRAEDGGLQFKIGETWWPSRPIGPHAFLVSHQSTEPAAFHVDENGRAYAVSFHLRYIGREES